MQYIKFLLPFILMAVINNTFAGQQSTVTNESNYDFHAYWTAFGCTGIHNGTNELCNHTAIHPSQQRSYIFNHSVHNIQPEFNS